MHDTVTEAQSLPTGFSLEQLCARKMTRAHAVLARRPELTTAGIASCARAAERLSAALGCAVSLSPRLILSSFEPKQSLSWMSGFALFELADPPSPAVMEIELPLLVAALGRLAGRTEGQSPVLELTRIEEAAFGYLGLLALRAFNEDAELGRLGARLHSVHSDRGAALANLEKGRHLAVELEVQLGELRGTVRIALPSRAVERWAQALSESNSPGTFPAATIPARCRMGRCELTAEALAQLGAGDVVVLEGLGSADGHLFGAARLFTARFDLEGRFSPEGFTPTRTIRCATLEIAMNAENPSLPIELEIELGRVPLPVADLANLREGTVMPLHLDLHQPVLLRVGEKTIARAELVELEGEIGARILNLF